MADADATNLPFQLSPDVNLLACGREHAHLWPGVVLGSLHTASGYSTESHAWSPNSVLMFTTP